VRSPGSAVRASRIAGTLRLPLLTVAVAWLTAWALLLVWAGAERWGPPEMRSATATDNSPDLALTATLLVLLPTTLGAGWSALAVRARGRRHPFRLGAVAGLLSAPVLVLGLLAVRLWDYAYYATLALVVVAGPVAAFVIGPSFTAEAEAGPARSRLAHVLAAVALPLGLYGGLRSMAALFG
jgi:hypothetical protein